MSEIVLQDEIDRKALEAMEGFSEMAGSGHFTPEQLLRVLGLLQTSLNGVLSSDVAGLFLEFMTESSEGHCCKVSDEAAFCLIQRPYISKTLLTRRISPRGSP